MLTAVLVLTARLWQLQLIRGESYGEMSDSNRTRLIRLTPSRGKIFDRQGRVLVDNRPSFTISVVRGELKSHGKLVEGFSPALGLPPEKLRQLVERSRAVPRFMAYPLKKNMTLEEVSLVSSRLSDIGGVVLEVKNRRHYPYGETLCHTLGTLGEISASELSGASQMGYRASDMVGKTGLEKEYEPHLKGVEGWEQIEIDAKGRQLGVLSTSPPEQGADITLTVDASLQRYVEEMFVHQAGSVVVVDADSGAVLAMVSKPGFDLGLFSPSITQRQWKILSDDPMHPLENRSVRGLYPPGSTFKMATAAAALAEKAVKPETTFTCKGDLELAGQHFRCWNRHGHGKVDLKRAIVESCDVYFYELGLKLGCDRIARYASIFGMGKPTGLTLPQELPGLIPTSLWKARTYGETWKDGETLNLSIGQGYLVATPIQLAMMTAALANGGKLLQPAIVKQIRASDGRVAFEHAPVERWKIPLREDHLEILRSAMTAVVSSNAGTGKKCRIPGVHVAGKTGTSQVMSRRDAAHDEEDAPYHERTHALFVAYVEHGGGRIAVVVVAEHGGAGGAMAAPIARRVICRHYGIADPGDPEEKTTSAAARRPE
jgi:penicillin-binding protein 2